MCRGASQEERGVRGELGGNARFGEEVAAFVKLRDGEEATPEEIRAYARGQIAHFKVPRWVWVVDDFPMTVTGKIQKFVMRERMVEELDLQDRKTA